MILNGKQEVKVDVSDEDIMMAALQIYKKRIGREEFAPLSIAWAYMGLDDKPSFFVTYTDEEKIVVDMFIKLMNK